MANPIFQNALGGLDERQLSRESVAFNRLEGAFPRLTGLQGRIEGKVTLDKYADAVWGIYQFWTPWGYPKALLQTPENLVITPWSPPKFNLPTLPDGTITPPSVVPGVPTVNGGGTPAAPTSGFAGGSPVPYSPPPPPPPSYDATLHVHVAIAPNIFGFVGPWPDGTSWAVDVCEILTEPGGISMALLSPMFVTGQNPYGGHVQIYYHPDRDVSVLSGAIIQHVYGSLGEVNTVNPYDLRTRYQVYLNGAATEVFGPGTGPP